MFQRKSKTFDDPRSVDKAGREVTEGEVQHWNLEKLLFDSGQGGYSIASGKLGDGKKVLAIRWNGDYSHHGQGKMPKTGTPAPGGIAEWFILPEFLWPWVIDACTQMQHAGLNE